MPGELTNAVVRGLVGEVLRSSPVSVLVRQLQGSVDELLGVRAYVGDGSPEGVLEAPLGALYSDRVGGLLYVKESEPSVSTGWVAK